jgi:ribonucleoside-diphosphate reductase alpha chain
MGFADTLLKLKIRYGSETSLDLADRVMECIHQAARETSIAGNFRNEVLTTIAPTGSISIIAGCSSGIEPIPYWETHHKREDLPDEVIVHTLAKPYVERGEKLPDCFVTAKELTPEEHITMQSVFQRHTDNAVSKTILFGEKATQEEVSKAMASAWEMGCKGITVYRDGSRADQVLSDARSVPRASNQATGASVERPYRLPGFTYKVKLDLGNDRFENLYVVVNDFPSSEPFEVFINGNIRDLQPNMAQFIDSLTRFISLCFRNRVAIGDIVEQLEKIPHAHLFSIPHKLAHILREHSSTGAKCPECGGQIAYSEGCMKCACGWSKCG